MELESASDSHGYFVFAFTMFRILWIEFNGCWYSVGVFDNPADDETVQVVRYRSQRHRLIALNK